MGTSSRRKRLAQRSNLFVRRLPWSIASEYFREVSAPRAAAVRQGLNVRFDSERQAPSLVRPVSCRCRDLEQSRINLQGSLIRMG